MKIALGAQQIPTNRLLVKAVGDGGSDLLVGYTENIETNGDLKRFSIHYGKSIEKLELSFSFIDPGFPNGQNRT